MKPLSGREIAVLAHWLEKRKEFVFLDNARPDGEEYRSRFFVVA
jgi:hypothetical protein